MQYLALPTDMIDQYPLCPLDDRYARDTKALRTYLATPALNKARLFVQTRYLIALADEAKFAELAPLTDVVRVQLDAIVCDFDSEVEGDLRAREKKIRHDVKATEYYLQDQFRARGIEVPVQFIRFAVTSEDDTNLAWGLLIHRALDEIIRPLAYDLLGQLRDFAERNRGKMMMGMTHGQPATPLSVEQRMMSFGERLGSLLTKLTAFRMQGKFGGATGSRMAHLVAYPEINWREFGRRFVESLGLTPLEYSTQINPHQDLAELCHLLSDAATVLVDLSQNMWLYISRGVFCQKINYDEVGSSVMPQKVNPQDWETGEGALEVAGCLLDFLAKKLPVSRMERHLSDSHLQRWLGTVLGAWLLGVKCLQKGLAKLQFNERQAEAEMVAHPEIWGEAIQTTMRRYGCTDAYERVKDFTQGKAVTAEDLCWFVEQQGYVPLKEQERLWRLIRYGPTAISGLIT